MASEAQLVQYEEKKLLLRVEGADTFVEERHNGHGLVANAVVQRSIHVDVCGRSLQRHVSAHA